MNLQTSPPEKTRIITLSVLSGIGITILFLLTGLLWDYVVVQVLSQFFLSDCSEDCYFAYFNAIFYAIALLSLVVGFVGGRRRYRRLVERAK